MKTEEQIAKAIEKTFKKECLGVSLTRREFIKDTIETPIKKFFDEVTGKYREEFDKKERDEITPTQKAYMKKFNANVDFRNASADYLLATSIGATQHGILQQSVFKYAEMKDDTSFLQWVFSNGKLENVSVVCTDTTTRLNSFLSNLYKDYVEGKKQLSEEKAAKAAAEEEAKAAAAAVEVMSDEDINKQISLMLEEKAKREKAKAAAN